LKAQSIDKSETDELPILKDKEKRRGGRAQENAIFIHEKNMGILQLT
jgi:hypothetical protein